MLSKLILHPCGSLLPRCASRVQLFGVNALHRRAWKPRFRQSSTKANTSSEVRRIFSYIGPEKKTLIAAIGLLGVSSFATLVFPFIIGRTIDTINQSATKAKMMENLNFIVAAVGGIVVIGGAANYGRVYLINIASQRITNRIRSAAHSAILKQETAFFDTQKTGELLSRLSSDAAQMGNSLTQNVSDGLRSLLAILGGTGMMVYTSPQLSLVGLSIVPPVAAFAIVYSKKLKKVASNVQSKEALSNGVAEEQFSNIRTVRMFTKESQEIERYSDTLKLVLDARSEEARKRAIFFGTTGATGNIIITSVLYYGGVLMADGLITVGSLSSFLIYAAYVGISMSGLSTFISETMKAIGASQKIWTLIDRQPSVPLNSGKTLENVVGCIDFRGVDFRYPTRDANILSELELRIPAGKVTAVVGPSGSGKSTLAGLILRFYDPSAGAVFLDGLDITEVNPTSLRSHIGVVSQEPVLFSTTIAQNVAYGSLKPVSSADIEDALRQANALDFVRDFPSALDTMVGERGIMLSGGQKQRIAIARAILRNPRILILDEATSSLDSISERQIQEFLEQFAAGRTVIVIAHRLSTIRRADNIVVLKGGRIVEEGLFEDLLKIENGVFSDLVNHQMRHNDV
ncbi:ATP-binding cassette sub-family B member 10, mitochondrial [Galendromus occidentalis]|uniref:ATP-binding cassette sub-family B member 10, mitochondrial n=1 Tax=Galendromus occidentalis TaxID=34638 RepID=A0AAJ6QM13_9ACAR|nr:ATP-binding cassette sub-family B member 10, mitochondrial [Galendromus occidentalis]